MTPKTPGEVQHLIDQIVARIHAQMAKPGIGPVTSNELRNRANYRRSLATQIKLQGGQVTPEFEPLNRTEELDDEQ